MALRSSLGALLDSEKTKIDSTRKETDDFYTQLHDQIQTTAINKDYYGRPILPEIISGSISHKGEYAVGLARFRSSTWKAQSRLFDKGLDALNASSVAWSEECPILDQDENIDQDDRDGVSCFSSPVSVRGIGIDLERIDASRGRRIERKVLTESEQLELGGLEVSGCRH
jgi:4'-phosphopantetheinyl transferase EntD